MPLDSRKNILKCVVVWKCKNLNLHLQTLLALKQQWALSVVHSISAVNSEQVKKCVNQLFPKKRALCLYVFPIYFSSVEKCVYRYFHRAKNKIVIFGLNFFWHALMQWVPAGLARELHYFQCAGRQSEELAKNDQPDIITLKLKQLE